VRTLRRREAIFADASRLRNAGTADRTKRRV
jgi:hypothetical protein